MWTAGGLYFSWSNIDEIYGDFQKKKAPLLSSGISFVSPSLIIENIRKGHSVDSVVSLQLIEILGKPYYQVRYKSAAGDDVSLTVQPATHLADATTGMLREPLTEEESVEVAKQRFSGEQKIKSVEYITNTNNHHEYRESPLPAYAVTF